MKRSGRHADVIHILLEENKTASLEARPGSRFMCVSGGAWLTQDGDLRDYFLVPGGEFFCTVGGEVVVTSLEPASVIVFERTVRPGRLGQLRVETIESLLQAAQMARSKRIGILATRGMNSVRAAFHRVSRAVRAACQCQLGKLK